MSGPPKTPLMTVDVIVEMDGGVVLIERKNPPHGWALPGGFVDVGERVPDAARREAREEIALDVELVELLHIYSDPTRDPRFHTCSAVYVARASGTPRAGDDAKNVRIHPLADLPPLAFDHAQILADYRRWRETGQRPAVGQ
jgi:ADP-ribose pyrophosphatase YjhB (NUDIX family)